MDKLGCSLLGEDGYSDGTRKGAKERTGSSHGGTVGAEVGKVDVVSRL